MANQYVTLAKIKDYLFGDQASVLVKDDALLGTLQDAAADFMDEFLGYSILTSTNTETRNGNGNHSISPYNFPIQAVTSVTVDDIALSVVTDALSYGYTFDENNVYLRHPYYGFPFPAGFFPLPEFFLERPRTFRKGFQNVVIVYTAGYDTLPADLSHALIELIAYKYKQKDRIGVTTSSESGIVTTSYTTDSVPPHVCNVFNHYQRLVV